jgi:ribosomal protein L21
MADDYRINVRFDLKSEADRSAAEYLQAIHRQNRKSRNRFIVEAVIEKIGGENSDKVLLESIRQIFREEVSSLNLVAAPAVPIATVKAELTEEQKADNAKSVLGDLYMFD